MFSIIDFVQQKMQRTLRGVTGAGIAIIVVILFLALVAALFLLGGWVFALCWNYGVVGTFAAAPSFTALKATAVLVVLSHIGGSLGLKRASAKTEG
jgi:type IV secretory pathway VirB2 component (pilin)